jgi:hypothetical protein
VTVEPAPTRPSGRTARCLARVVLLAGPLISLRADEARADRYEATLVVRPTGTLGRVAEDVGSDGSSMVASVYGGGLDVGLSYGLRNWLDLGGELGAAGFTRATYDPAAVGIMGSALTGRVERTTRAAQLRAGATLRLGVAWVPVLYVGLGVGGRQRTDGTVVRDDRGVLPNGIAADGMPAGFSLDLVMAARAGLEHRLDRRWTAGVDMSASHAIGIGSPPLDVVSIGVSLSYTWYPVFSP